MKISIRQIKSEESLELHGGKLFTETQLKEIMGA